MEPLTPLYAAFLLLVVGAIAAAAVSGRARACSWISLGFVSASSISLLYLAIYVFVRGTIENVELLSLHRVIGSSLSVGVDPLSALLLLIMGVISFCVTLFSIRYVRRYEGESLLRYYPLLLLLFASIVGVVAARDMLFFIFFWETMTLTSWALVVYERENRTNLKAGLQYFVATHVTSALIVISTVLLYSYSPGPSFSFEALRASLDTLISTNPALVHLVLALFFVGFVTKAGVLPFGFWLPDAYPAAPSSASAAFAGVMTKSAVYGLVRVFCTILPISEYSQTWGIVIAVFGTLSIFIGSMSALTQNDAKRLFSFSVVGQIGYMLLSIGAGLYLLPINPAIAAVCIIAGVFHLLNDAFYKSCLFLNAGSILYRTGVGDLNKVGGLSRVMPLTATAAIVASLALAGLPPFSGFASKLLIFESTIMGSTAAGASVWAKGLFIVLGLAAVFISAVTLAYVLKFLNSAFMGKLRGIETASAGDVPLSMKIPQGVLAFLCILFGVVPLLPITMAHKAVSDALPAGVVPASAELFGKVWPGISVDFGTGMVSGAWNPLWIIVAFGTVAGLVYFAIKAGGAKVRQVETWYGGRPHIPADVSYRGHSFYVPFKKLFSFRARSVEFQGLYPVSLPLPKARMPQWLRVLLHPDQWLYYPLAGLFPRVCRGISRSHTGYPQLYLLWIALGMILVLVVIFWVTGG